MEILTKKIILPLSKTEVEMKEHLLTGEYFEMQKADDITKFAIENLIISIGEEKDKTKFYELVMKMVVTDYKLIDEALSLLYEPILPKKK